MKEPFLADNKPTLAYFIGPINNGCQKSARLGGIKYVVKESSNQKCQKLYLSHICLKRFQMEYGPDKLWDPTKSIQTWPKASLTWVVSYRRFCPLLASLSPLQEKTQSYHIIGKRPLSTFLLFLELFWTCFHLSGLFYNT